MLILCCYVVCVLVAVVLEKLADVSGVLSAEYTYGQPVQQPHFLMQCWLGGAGQVQVGRDTEYPVS